MPEEKNVEDDKSQLDDKGAEDRTDGGDEIISELLTRYPQLQRYVDKRVTEGIKTYITNQKKKEPVEIPPEAKVNTGARGGDVEMEKTMTASMKEKQEKPMDSAAQLALEAQRQREGLAIEKELARRGLDAFAGIISDPTLIDDLEKGALEFLSSQNIGADFSPVREQPPMVNLSPIEEQIARKLGISPMRYANQKQQIDFS